MRAIKFNKNKHLTQIKEWAKNRGVSDKVFEELPTIGLIIPGIAVGFLRKVEGGSLIMDGLMTNGHATGDVRHKAMDLLMNSLFILAAKHNYKRIIGFTVDLNTHSRATRLGYTTLAHALVAIEVK